MKAPDKIYLNIPKDSPAIYNNDVLEIATWSTKEFADCKNVCYIRKDALLEFIEKQSKNWSSDSVTGQGVKTGLFMIKDKLESM